MWSDLVVVVSGDDTVEALGCSGEPFGQFEVKAGCSYKQGCFAAHNGGNLSNKIACCQFFANDGNKGGFHGHEFCVHACIK
jgi:hypothetical protein